MKCAVEYNEMFRRM